MVSTVKAESWHVITRWFHVFKFNAFSVIYSVVKLASTTPECSQSCECVCCPATCAARESICLDAPFFAALVFSSTVCNKFSRVLSWLWIGRHFNTVSIKNYL
jgi:hypothetical protein